MNEHDKGAFTELVQEAGLKQNENVSEPEIAVPKFFGLLTDATVSVIEDFSKSFIDDIKKCNRFRVIIKGTILLFLILTLISAFLFVVAQIKEQYGNIVNTTSQNSTIDLPSLEPSATILESRQTSTSHCPDHKVP